MRRNGRLLEFEELRPRLMAIAYRMLGSSGDAEDAVQDAWLRWQRIDSTEVRDPRAWLSMTLGRICIDRLTSARARRESYPGTWLPEPVFTPEPIDVESISLGFLVVLERLSPIERAVFILHQVFEYSHSELALSLGMSEMAVRQAFHRAKLHVAENRPRFSATREDHERLLRAFANAVTTGDIGAVKELLAEDAVLWADGGGKVRGAAGRPVEGSTAIARFFIGLLTKSMFPVDHVFEIENVNGWPAFVGRTSQGIDAVVTIETDGSRINAIRNVLNPDKLALRSVD